MNFNSVFENIPKITDNTKIVFVFDTCAEDTISDSEMTMHALINSCPLEFIKLKSNQVNLDVLKQGHRCHWIFGNFIELDSNLIPTIVANMKYSIIENDYKYCKFRSPEKHQNITETPCDCNNQINGKIISAFFQGSQSIWWMSEAQKEKYLQLFPFLNEKDNIVLSSVFDKSMLGTIKLLREHAAESQKEKKGWIVIGSDSWIKGTDAAKKWCEDNNKDYEITKNISYDEMLNKLVHAEGLVYLPAGADACSRVVIEAKLLGCKLHLNDLVQHSTEDWFNESIEDIHDYLFTASGLFWTSIKKILDYMPTISGYTTTYNCISQEYPFVKCIESMLLFANEVCVVDGGSTDGTWEKLQDLANKNAKIKLKMVSRNWNHKRHAVFDGMQKAESRAMCTSDFCWQMDSDEIIRSVDAEKIISLATKIPPSVDILSLPVIDFWGKNKKVRIDVTPWKWRLSRNKKNITHGIPTELRRIDDDGDTYSLQGSDGCDLIDSETGERINHVTFINENSENARQHALNGNEKALAAYEEWFNHITTQLPSVLHYSWFDLERKIKTYKNYWSRHWESLYNIPQNDTAENNMFFNKPWSQVTDQEINELANKLEEIGGWIWHKKWDGTKTPSIRIENV